MVGVLVTCLFAENKYKESEKGSLQKRIAVLRRRISVLIMQICKSASLGLVSIIGTRTWWLQIRRWYKGENKNNLYYEKDLTLLLDSIIGNNIVYKHSTLYTNPWEVIQSSQSAYQHVFGCTTCCIACDNFCDCFYVRGPVIRGPSQWGHLAKWL